VSIYGIKVYVDHFLCQPDEIRQRRTNRKSRINKKWRKKYGIERICHGRSYIFSGNAHMCPHFHAKLKKKIDVENESVAPEAFGRIG